MLDVRRGPEPSDRQKAMVLQAFVDDLSFWGDLTSVAATSTPTSTSRGASPSTGRPVAAVATTRLSPTHLQATKDISTPTINSSWKTAVDAASGKTYYYDVVTRRTQWEKPAEIRELERQQRREQKQKDLLFFKEMERNILTSLKRGHKIPCTDPPPPKEETHTLPPVRARTISGMDEVLLQQFSAGAPAKPSKPATQNTSTRPRDAHGRPPLNPSSGGRAALVTNPSELSFELSPEQMDRNHPLRFSREETGELELRGEALLDGPLDDDAYEMEAPKNQQHHVRRNTGGTIYLKTTMMNPDIQATIKCVCGVYRAHILQASSKRSGQSPVSVALSHNQSLGDIFLDQSPGTEIPTLDEVISFYQDFYVRSQMEHDTIIMSLIYVERLIKEATNIAPLPENWRSVLFSCMVLASKVWDDLSMWNIDFSNVCGRSGFSFHDAISSVLALRRASNQVHPCGYSQ